MNRVFRKALLSVLALATFSGCPLLNHLNAASAADMLARPYEWTVRIQLKELKHQFEYNGSHIKPVVKASLDFYPKSNEDDKTKYEFLWFSKGRPLGMERLHKLDITKGDAIAILVKHDDASPSYDEQRAAAKAVLRVVLDANLNKNMVATVKVPHGSFNTIVHTIEEYGFEALSSTADAPLDSDMNIYVQTEDGSESSTLYHHS